MEIKMNVTPSTLNKLISDDVNTIKNTSMEIIKDIETKLTENRKQGKNFTVLELNIKDLLSPTSYDPKVAAIMVLYTIMLTLTRNGFVAKWKYKNNFDCYIIYIKYEMKYDEEEIKKMKDALDQLK